MCVSLLQLTNHFENIPCCLFIYVFHCCMYNRSLVNVVHAVNVGSKSFIITLLFYGAR